MPVHAGAADDPVLNRGAVHRRLAQCISRGLVGGKGFAVDASLISADVQTQSSSRQDEWDASTIDPSDELTLAATAQNLRKMAKLCPIMAPSASVG